MHLGAAGHQYDAMFRPCGMDGCSQKRGSVILTCITPGKCLSAVAVAFYFHVLCVS